MSEIKPSNWAEVFYLIRKEIRNRSDLPPLSLEDIQKIHQLFWTKLKPILANKDSEISLESFARFIPRRKQIDRYNKQKEYQNERKRLQASSSDQ